MMTLITGFTCPPTIYFKFITKCDSVFITNCDGLLLQSATGITKCDYYKTRQCFICFTKCDSTPPLPLPKKSRVTWQAN